ncbi:hypothetical protein PHLGIDRAFT_130281 [Phlebiopsis gigantea 11061_1 CR5-6]|uniref:Uncharacterized protein n=1 Tax=Phlebiopsis gigantea (strain 11061_1 CR5-6) TaxID=745531 RepID=A0A0C3RSA9_PHLG1|nr:hypothetical protein PHLGIDRAFT_130281 [Phlebiopsis gigantea 11061_1 CR5-6]
MSGNHAAAVCDGLCSPECEGEDVGTILRHLALGRLSGWKKRSDLKDADAETAPDMARIASFSSDTYADFLATNEAFFALLSGLIQKRPWTVHEALDAHVYLVWFKYATQPRPLMNGQSTDASSSTTQGADIKWNYVLDNISVAFQQYAKRLDPTLPAEARSFVQFIGSKSDAWANGKLEEPAPGDLSRLISHLSDVLVHVTVASESTDCDTRGELHEFCSKQCCEIPPNFNTDAIFRLFREQPGLSSAELVHPLLPVLCILAELVKVSQSAVTELTGPEAARTGMASVFGCLCRLWTRQFLLPQDYRYGTWSGSGVGPGRWVTKDKRTYAMRLATCLFLARIAQAATRLRASDEGWERMDALVQCLTATPALQAWTWEVISASLVFQDYFNEQFRRAINAEVRLTKEQQKDKEVHRVYAEVLGHVQYLVRSLEARQNKPRLDDLQVIPVEQLVLIFEDVPVDVPSLVLGSVLSVSVTSREWNAAITILASCNASNAAHFRRVLTHFVQQLLAGSVPGHDRRVARLLRREASSIDFSREARLFMPHPTDRFLMLLVSAAERNPRVATAIRDDLDTKWAVMELISKVQEGAFDVAEAPETSTTWG